MESIGKISRQRLGEVLRRAKGSPLCSRNVADYLGISVDQARVLLSLWAKNGWLTRIKQGVYLPVDIAAVSPDQVFVDSWVLAEGLFSPCYIGGWSAAQFWDFTEQIFQSTLVITTRRINGKQHVVLGTTFLLKQCKAQKLFGTQMIWRDQKKIAVSDPHKTIIDILDAPALAGGIRSALDFLQAYLASSHFDAKILLEYAKQMQNGTIFKRLGFLLSSVYFPDREVINFCLEHKSVGYSQLDPTLMGKRLVKKWGLWVPEGFKNDD